MTTTFSDLADLEYELNDAGIVNDVLMIVGETGEEVLVRGYDQSSIDKYGRRSQRIDRPIVANEEAAYATPKAQITAILDHDIEPYALVVITVVGKTDALIEDILGLEISDLIQITELTCGLNAAYFIVESIDLDIPNSGLITATIGAVEARASEIP